MPSDFEDLIIFQDWMGHLLEGSAGRVKLKAEGEEGDIELEMLSSSLLLFSLP